MRGMRGGAAMAAVLLRWAGAIDINDTISGYCGTYGIEVEEHTVLTQDGYLLGLFRLPNYGAPAVVLYHGVMASSWIWISHHPNVSLGFELYRRGYDVWMPNSRGNMFSLSHKTFNHTRDPEFWDFSFVDAARHDLPANIAHVLRATGRRSLTFVGHSEAAAMFWMAMAMEKPLLQLQGQVNLFIGLGPIAYLDHQTSKLLVKLKKSGVVDLLYAAYPFGIPKMSGFSQLAQRICLFTGDTCRDTYEMVVGRSDSDVNEVIANISINYPAGTSVKNLKYYAQLHSSGRVEEFDYGEQGNRRHYGSPRPPEYEIGEYSVPTALFIGGNDNFASPIDSQRLSSKLSDCNVVFDRTFEGYSHMTWLAGDERAYREWSTSFYELVHTFNPVSSMRARGPGDGHLSFLARAPGTRSR